MSDIIATAGEQSRSGWTAYWIVAVGPLISCPLVLKLFDIFQVHNRLVALMLDYAAIKTVSDYH